jgi:hypothetical protein
VVTTAPQAAALVDEMAKWGVRTLKLYVRTDRAVGREVIRAAHRRKMLVTGHLGAYRTPDAVADGIDCLEHIWAVWHFAFPAEPASVRERMDLGNPVAAELIQQLADRRTMLDPTLVVFRNMILLPDTPAVRDHPDNLLAPARLIQQWRRDPAVAPPASTLWQRRREFAKYKELTGMLHRAGVPLLAGTDTPEPFVPPGFSLHQELELLVESGLTPAEALRCATIGNAKSLGSDHELGRIAPGHLADLVVLDSDPLADIRNTRTISTVIRSGCVCPLEQIVSSLRAAAHPPARSPSRSGHAGRNPDSLQRTV